MGDWTIERLGRAHARGEFACGKAPLDDFIRVLVSQYEKRDLGRTYVALRSGESCVIGYYTLASGAISFRDLPRDAARKLPKHPVPVVLLARLAVDRSAREERLGEALLMDALSRCLGLAEPVGVHAVEVDAIDEEARSFYLKYGFVPLLDDPHHLYLPIATIKSAF